MHRSAILLIESLAEAAFEMQLFFHETFTRLGAEPLL